MDVDGRKICINLVAGIFEWVQFVANKQRCRGLGGGMCSTECHCSCRDIPVDL